MAKCCGSSISSDIINNGSFVILGIGYKLTERNGLEGIYGAVTALSAVLILTPQVVGKTEGVIPTEILGAKGMFLGIIVSIITSELYSYFTKKEITIKCLKVYLTKYLNHLVHCYQ